MLWTEENCQCTAVSYPSTWRVLLSYPKEGFFFTELDNLNILSIAISLSWNLLPTICDVEYFKVFTVF